MLLLKMVLCYLLIPEKLLSNPYSISPLFQRWLEKGQSFMSESKENVGLESLVVLLKCMKIMENATFLSKENQVGEI